MDDRLISRAHRYGYSAVIGEVGQATISLTGDFADEAFGNALLKHDLAAGTVQRTIRPRRDRRRGRLRPGAPDAAEDDGYVMAFVHNPDRGAPTW